MTLRYARIIDGIVAEICDAPALATHHPDLAATFIACPDYVDQLWQFAAPDNWAAPGEALPKKKGAKK